MFPFLPPVHFLQWAKPQCHLTVLKPSSSVFEGSFGKSHPQFKNARLHPPHEGSFEEAKALRLKKKTSKQTNKLANEHGFEERS